MAYVDINDVVKGRVLMMNPMDIGNSAEIGALPGVNPLGGNSPHYFICVGRGTDGYSYWCPVSSSRKPTGIGTLDMQGMIPKESKIGFTHYYNGQSWYDAGQVWRVPNQDAINSANKEQCNRRQGSCFNQVASSLIDSIFPGAKDLH
jgi:hypothetical protein